MASEARQWGAFVVCSVIWGTTWLAIKEGYAGLDAFWAAAFRFAIASLVLLVLAAVRRTRLRMTREEWAVIGFVGLVLFSLDYGLIYWGEQFLDSGLTAILFATMPLFTGVLSGLAIPAERLTARQLLGILLGGIGLGLVFQASLSVEPADLVPMGAIVVSAAAAGSASVVVRRWGRGIPVASLNGYAMLIGAIVLTGTSLVAGERQGLPTETAGWWSVLYLALLGSVVTFLLYLWLLRHWSANRSSFVALATPVVAVVAGVVVRAERLTLVQGFGAMLVLAGVAVAVYAHAAAQAPLVQEKVGEEGKEESDGLG